MTGLQIFMVLFGLVGLAVTIWAIVAIVKSPRLGAKPLWIAASLVANVGFTINWTTPGDLYGWFGIQVPFVMFYTIVGTGQWIAKVGFPVLAVAALVKCEMAKRAAG